MNRKVRIGRCDVGNGVFAESLIAEGDTILFITGKIVSRAENDELDLEGAYSVQIGNDRYIDPRNPSRFLNHSCEPNAGIDPNLRLIALRDIPAEEEIRFDYSTSMMERSWTMVCKCGANRCRKVVDDFDRLPEKVRNFYLDRHVVQDFILSEMENFVDNQDSAA